MERTIVATTHGRFLALAPVNPAPAPVLIGFHGYAELAEVQLDRMRAIPGAERWLLVSVQGLNRFYQRRSNEVVAGWMTSQHREVAIADNIAYVNSVVDAVRREWTTKAGIVFAGFSQGVAMAFRAAASSSHNPAGVIAVGGDVPPEIDSTSLARIGRVLVCHGKVDQWYTSEIFARDVERLRSAGVDVRGVEYDSGHDWSEEVQQASSSFLASISDTIKP
jgi:predicted esterase